MFNQEQLIDNNSGFGESTQSELAELRKALDIGYSQPVTGVGFDALRVESLESTLKLLTYSAKHIKFWNLIPKLDAYSTVEEYNRLIQYGSDGGGFVASGQLPETDDTTYERADQKVKYIGTTREVHHPATLVRTVPADLIAQETSNGVLWMLGKIERALFYGDANADALQWNGITAQIIQGSGNVIDLRGQPLDKDTIENAVELSVDNFGLVTKFLSNPKVMTDFSKTLYPAQRTGLGEGGLAGTPIRGYNSLLGQIDFEPDLFVTKGSSPPASPTSAKAPNTPTLGTAGIGTGTAGSLFAASDVGNYYYAVTACNAFGESAPVSLGSPTAQNVAAAGDDSHFTITDGGGLYGATFYKIYRSAKGAASTAPTNYIGFPLYRAKSNNVYSATTVYTDLNQYIPSTFIGLFLDMTTQSLSFKQLAPLLKMPLALIAPSIRWMQLLYGTPIVYAPKKNVVLINVGVQS